MRRSKNSDSGSCIQYQAGSVMEDSQLWFHESVVLIKMRNRKSNIWRSCGNRGSV